jgi:hypothetical protein
VLYAFAPVATSSTSLAMRAATAATCAGEQGKFWEVHDMFFRLTRIPAEAEISHMVLPMVQDQRFFTTCSAKATFAPFQDRLSRLKDLGLPGTPSFLFGFHEQGRNTQMLYAFTGARDLPEFRSILDRLLAPAPR